MARTQIITPDGKKRNTSQYNRFSRMKQRCLNPSDKAYHNYGGRGIQICERWQDFQAFNADMGECPTPDHSLDRINNEGHYSCGKCEQCIANGWPPNYRWATDAEQRLNTRANAWLTKDGKTQTIFEWAKELGVSPGTLCSRRSRGLTDERVLASVQQRQPYQRRSRQFAPKTST